MPTDQLGWFVKFFFTYILEENKYFVDHMCLSNKILGHSTSLADHLSSQ